MKVITIPERFGYPTVDITVNGIEHTLETGVEVEVEDNVAAVVENALALAPKYGRAGGKIAQLAEDSLTELTAEDLAGISMLSSCAFYKKQSLKKVTIPNNITTISTSVFEWCSNLASVYLPEIPPRLVKITSFSNIKADCIFYCKTQESLNAYKAAENWSTLSGTYTFAVES